MVRFASNALEVNEAIGSVGLCLEAVIDGIFERALTLTLSTITDTASEVQNFCVCSK